MACISLRGKPVEYVSTCKYLGFYIVVTSRFQFMKISAVSLVVQTRFFLVHLAHGKMCKSIYYTGIVYQGFHTVQQLKTLQHLRCGSVMLQLTTQSAGFLAFAGGKAFAKHASIIILTP